MRGFSPAQQFQITTQRHKITYRCLANNSGLLQGNSYILINSYFLSMLFQVICDLLFFLHVLLPWQHTGISHILPFLSCISPCISCHIRKQLFSSTNKRKRVQRMQKDHPTASKYKFDLIFRKRVATVNYYKFY